VSNTGPALPPGVQERLFDSLVSERRQRGGEPHLGLGLFVVRLVAEFHGGDARAENTPHGVRVTLALPAYPRDLTPRRPPGGCGTLVQLSID
jgi:two-component system, OmpR family, sensor histidine kinase ChvG